MSEPSTKISLVALAISIGSFVLSGYFGFRDKYKVVATSKFYPDHEYGSASVHVKVVNVGRRLVILRLFGGDHSDGGWSGEYLEKVEGGLYLKENEFLEKTLHWDDLHSMGPDYEVAIYKNLWVEDSRGHRH